MPEASAPAAPGSVPVAAASTEAGSQPAGSQGNQGAAGASPAAAAPKAPAKPELLEVKVDGKVIKMTKDEAIQYASMGHAAQKRFQEAAQMRKQAEAAIGRIKDPEQLLAALQDPALGYSRDKIREVFENWYAREFIETEKLTPAEKELREAQAQLKKYADADREREQQKQKEQDDAMTTQARVEIQKQLIEALETGSLPKTNFTIRRLAYWIQRNTANGFNAPTEVLVSQVRNEFNTSMRDMVENSDGETLIKLLGDNIVQKLRRYDLEQLRKLRQGPAAPAGTQETSPPTQKSDRAPTSAEVNQRIRQLQKTGRY